MVPNGSAYANYPSFANNGTKTPPGGATDSAKYALGMVPADTFPAEWANWFFHGATAGITRLNQDTGSIKKEINSVLAAFNITNDASVFNQLLGAMLKIFPKVTTCTTAAATGAKDIAVTGIDGTNLKAGDVFVVTMTYGNTYGDGATTYPTLSVNSGTAYPLCDARGAYLKNGSWQAGDVITVIFTGTKFVSNTITVDTVTAGDMRAVTSNAVWNKIVAMYPVDTVTAGDMRAVTSNAVWNKIVAMYPVGTIYQNAFDATNPATFFGFGTWVQITDAFLAARGYALGASGGAWNVTLNYNNIPRHAHTVSDHTHYMNHVHYFNASHNHDITDNGHDHKIVFDDREESNGGIPYSNQTSPYGSALIIGAETKYYTKVRAYISTTGISVNQKTVTGYTGPQISEDETHETYIRTQGAYGAIYTDWQYAENPAAFSIIPPYVGVYIWKRTA